MENFQNYLQNQFTCSVLVLDSYVDAKIFSSNVKHQTKASYTKCLFKLLKPHIIIHSYIVDLNIFNFATHSNNLGGARSTP